MTSFPLTEADTLLQSQASGFSPAPPQWEQKKSWLAINVLPCLLKSGPLRVKFVLTLLKYEPVSVFYVINCDCQFPLSGKE